MNIAPMTMHNARPMNFGKLVVNDGVSPETVADLVSNEKFLGLLVDTDLNGYDVHVKKDTNFNSIFAKEKGNSRLGKSECLCVSNLNEPLDVDYAETAWQKVKQQSNLKDSFHSISYSKLAQCMADYCNGLLSLK